jgi:hypothetical protein
VPLSAADSVTPAIEHAKAQLFRPYRLGQWTRLALVGLFAGEMSSGGGCNSFHLPPHTSGGGPHRDYLLNTFPDPWVWGPLLAVLLIAAPIVWLVFLYVSSRMRFVLFDSVIAKRCEIGRMWGQRGEPAMRYFVWQIVFALVSLAGLAIIIGVPALIGFASGWFTDPRNHLVGLILTGIVVFFAFVAWLVLAAVAHVFTKDFVVPQMALEEISAFEGWGRLLKMMGAEKGGYAGYAGMKLVLAIAAAIIFGIAAFFLILILLIPVGGMGLITVLTGHAAGLTWNVLTITAAVVAGCIFFLVLFYCVALISVPVIVFFPAYSIYFFAGRYAKLGSLIYPLAPAPPPAIPPPVTPSIAPVPEPGT